MDVVLTAFLSGLVDMQRPGHRLAPDLSKLEPLLTSLDGHHVVVLHNELEVASSAFVHFERVALERPNPYVERWYLFRDWLIAHPEVERAWCVDGTDVELLHDPFPHMRSGTVYVGSEEERVWTPWLLRQHTTDATATHIADHPDERLLNCGLLGGDRADVLGVLSDMCELLPQAQSELPDMGVFNVAVGRHQGPVRTGPIVHTVFWAEDRDAPSWWRHK